VQYRIVLNKILMFLISIWAMILANYYLRKLREDFQMKIRQGIVEIVYLQIIRNLVKILYII